MLSVISHPCVNQQVSEAGHITALLSGALFVLILIAAAVRDIRTRTIPDRYSAAICLLALGSLFSASQISPASRFAGALCVSVPMLMLTVLRPGALGGGDIKLMAAGGMFLGWRGAILSIFLAVLTGGVACMFLLLTSRETRKDTIIFGPFLCLGLILTLLFGDDLLKWILIPGV